MKQRAEGFNITWLVTRRWFAIFKPVGKYRSFPFPKPELKDTVVLTQNRSKTFSRHNRNRRHTLESGLVPRTSSDSRDYRLKALTEEFSLHLLSIFRI